MVAKQKIYNSLLGTGAQDIRECERRTGIGLSNTVTVTHCHTIRILLHYSDARVQSSAKLALSNSESD